jgi:hypothetical protein
VSAEPDARRPRERPRDHFVIGVALGGGYRQTGWAIVKQTAASSGWTVELQRADVVFLAHSINPITIFAYFEERLRRTRVTASSCPRSTCITILEAMPRLCTFERD